MNKKDKHPGYIFKRSEENYSSLKLTHSEYRAKKKKNVPLDINPNPKDKSQAYLEKRVREYPMNVLSNVMDGWELSEADKKKIVQILSKYKK